MAITGIFLLVFITGHALGNLQIFIGKEALNTYAAFLQSLGEILWAERILLFLSLVLHIITSVYLKLYNNKARPDKYVVKSYVTAKLNSRTMIWTGIMIAAFMGYHIAHFTTGNIQSENYHFKEMYTKNAYTVDDDEQAISNLGENELSETGDKTLVQFERHDVYKMVILGFRNPWISGFYIIAVILLGFHLSHAMQSFFQTLGIAGPRFTPFIRKVSVWYGILLSFAFLIVPLAILLGLIGGDV
jgi:succinate dehydrogenase / fumarate reductase cytochrome b subunit